MYFYLFNPTHKITQKEYNKLPVDYKQYYRRI